VEGGEAETVGVWVCNGRVWNMAVLACRQHTRITVTEQRVAVEGRTNYGVVAVVDDGPDSLYVKLRAAGVHKLLLNG
jgi:hypothetical protein